MSKSRAPPGQRPQRQLTSMHEFRGFRCRELHLLCCWGRDSRGGGKGRTWESCTWYLLRA